MIAITPDEYLTRTLQPAIITDDEYKLIDEFISAVARRLKRLMPETDQFLPFGSVTRRTALSPRISPHFDFDLLAIMKIHNQLTFFSGIHCTEHPMDLGQKKASQVLHEQGINLETARRQRLMARLRSDPSFAEVTEDYPSIRFYPSMRVEIVKPVFRFELTPASDIGGGMLCFYRQTSALEKEFKDDIDLDDYGGVSIGDSDFRVETTDPLFFNRILDQYDNIYGPFWRLVILTLKYWNLANGSPLPSYVIEMNTLMALQSAAPFAKCEGLFDLVATLVLREDLYHFELFSKRKEFLALFRAIERAVALNKKGAVNEATQVMVSVIPPPTLLTLQTKQA